MLAYITTLLSLDLEAFAYGSVAVRRSPIAVEMDPLIVESPGQIGLSASAESWSARSSAAWNGVIFQKYLAWL